jgi:hypothetical protein
MSKVKATLALGVLLLAGLGVYTLTRAPVRVVSRSGAPENATLGVTIGDTVLCQPGEVLPAGVTAIRLPLIAFYGANVNLIAFKGSQMLTTGSHRPTWTGVSVTVPVKPLASTATGVNVCFSVSPNSEPLIIPGDTASRREAAVVLRSGTLTPTTSQSPIERLRGRLALEYVTSGRTPWWSRIVTVARHMGLGRAYSGTWIALLVAALMLLVAGLTARLTLKELP